jgi:sugar lactone lactonase YvrE
MTKSARNTQANSPRSTARVRWKSIAKWGLASLILVSAGVAIWLATRPATPPPQVRVGGVAYCRGLPRFAQTLGFGGQMFLSTSERLIKGLVMYEVNPATGARRTFQDPSWDDAGYLGPITFDGDGNVYVAPVPRISLVDNPPEKQNIIYRVDTDTGVMSEFLSLPAPEPPSSSNPFGVLGLTHDCDTHSLYATSVAGSTRSRELGRIYRIDPSTGQVVSHFDDVDALGIGVFNGAHGKRLYFGSARVAEVRSIALDEHGDFVGEPRAEFSIIALSGGRDEKARRMSFDSAGGMLLYGVEFNFNLVATSEPLQTLYRFRYNPSQDGWELLAIEP